MSKSPLCDAMVVAGIEKISIPATCAAINHTETTPGTCMLLKIDDRVQCRTVFIHREASRALASYCDIVLYNQR